MMRSVLLVVAAVTLSCGLAAAGTVTEWWGPGADCRHHTWTVTHNEDGSHVLKVDLKQIPRSATVHRAVIRAVIEKPKMHSHSRAYMEPGYIDPLGLYAEVSPRRPAQLFALKVGPDGTPTPEAERFKLVGPRYRAFDVTELVRGWVAGTRPNLGILVKDLDYWCWNYSYLEVSYAGTVTDPPRQAAGIQAVHRKGQTFITWTEIEKLITEPKVLWKDFLPVFLKAYPIVRNTWHKHPPLTEKRTVLYRIYRHAKPITAENLHEAELIDEMYPLSGYAGRVHQHRVAGEVWKGLDKNVIVPRYTIRDVPPAAFKANGTYSDGHYSLPQWTAPQIPLHTGLYVHQARTAGRGYYAVTAMVNGVENTRDISTANAPAEPVAETVGPGEPILYRRLDAVRGGGKTHKQRETQFHLYWAAPPYANLPRFPIHVGVTILGPPDAARRAASVQLGLDDMYYSSLLHGYLGFRGKHTAEPQIVITIYHTAQTDWEGYNSSFYTSLSRNEGAKQPYMRRLVELLLTWSEKRFNVDPARARRPR